MLSPGQISWYTWRISWSKCGAPGEVSKNDRRASYRVWGDDVGIVEELSKSLWAAGPRVLIQFLSYVVKTVLSIFLILNSTEVAGSTFQILIQACFCNEFGFVFVICVWVYWFGFLIDYCHLTILKYCLRVEKVSKIWLIDMQNLVWTRGSRLNGAWQLWIHELMNFHSDTRNSFEINYKQAEFSLNKGFSFTPIIELTSII